MGWNKLRVNINCRNYIFKCSSGETPIMLNDVFSIFGGCWMFNHVFDRCGNDSIVVADGLGAMF